VYQVGNNFQELLVFVGENFFIESHFLRVLFTSNQKKFAERLGKFLGNRHFLQSVDIFSTINAEDSFSSSRAKIFEEVSKHLTEIDVLIHSGLLSESVHVSDRLNYNMHNTYQLLDLAVKNGVKRVIYLSTLHVMDQYSESFAVTENWRPVPSTDPHILGPYLGEVVCKEFAREGKIEVILLRLGDLIDSVDSAKPMSNSSLYVDDAFQAIEKAFSVSMAHEFEDRSLTWLPFHIQSNVPNKRFLTDRAELLMNYKPIDGLQMRL